MATQAQQVNITVNVEQSRANALEKEQGLSKREAGQSVVQVIIINVSPNQTKKEEGNQGAKSKKLLRKIREKISELVSWVNIVIFFSPYFPALVEFLKNF